ncbi:MAG: glycogen/starch synthase [Candidatus Woesearchaeota archaeon]
MITLFEVSFEIANKVGGIHTVVSSKVQYLAPFVKDHILIGPYFESSKEFTKQQTPQHYQQTFETLAKEGIIAHYGQWNIPAKPQVILLEFGGAYDQLDYYKGEFYEHFEVDSLFAQHDYNEPFAFSIAAGKLIEQLLAVHPHKPIVQTHEWMTGITNLYCKFKQLPIKTVFTTHATMLGRAIVGNGENLYELLPTLNAFEKAKQLQIFSKFTCERASALFSDAFTTVSNVTAHECEIILGKKPQVTPNGFDIDDFPNVQHIFAKQEQSREKLNQFLQYFFYPYYKFDLEKTTLLFTSGRHEVRSKGIDVTLEAMNILEQKFANSDQHIVLFIFVPYSHQGPLQHVLRHKEQIEKKQPFSQPPKPQPELSAFSVDHNQIHDLCAQFNITNEQSKKVKLVYYPVYLEGNDGLLNQEYYDAICGCDIAVFPSFYEPWGYTPMESAVLAIPTITTNLAGFGQYVEKKSGITVLNRQTTTDTQCAHDIANAIEEYINLSDHKKMLRKLQIKLTATCIDWQVLIKKYQEIYEGLYNAKT